MAWWPGIDRKQISQGAGGKPRILFIDPEVGWIDLRDWSGDGKWLAVTLTRGADRTAQIGLVSAADGSLRVLKSVDWGRERPSKMAFSPDGKFLAYDIPTRSGSQQRDIYLLAVDGSHEAPVAVHPAHVRVLGWAPDGGHLLFASDRSGANALWAVLR